MYEIIYYTYMGPKDIYPEQYQTVQEAVKSALELEKAGHKIYKIIPVK